MKGRCIAVSLGLEGRIIKQNKIKKSLPRDGCVRRYFPVPFQTGEAPRCACLTAFFTLEAAIILPLLACFFVSILFFFRVLQIELEVQRALGDTGRTLAAYAAADSVEINIASAKVLFMKELSDSENICRFIKNKAAGISILNSEFEGDFIKLKADYTVRLPVGLLGKQQVRMSQCVQCRKWTGWQPAGTEDEENMWVYITETGTVYHTSRECSHIKLAVRQTGYETLSTLRSENGNKYYACDIYAAKVDKNQIVYITNQGDRYHVRLDCSGIKRTVLMVRLSEAGGRLPCSKCGGERK